MDVDGGDGEGPQDKAMIIDQRYLFVPFLSFTHYNLSSITGI